LSKTGAMKQAFQNGLPIGVRPLEEAAVAPEHLVFRVAGQVLEGTVGEDDRIVRQVGIGEDDRHPGHLDGGEEHAAPLIKTRVCDCRPLPVVDARPACRVVGDVLVLAGCRNTDTLAVALHIEQRTGLLLPRVFVLVHGKPVISSGAGKGGPQVIRSRANRLEAGRSYRGPARCQLRRFVSKRVTRAATP
jgi:hypothetical protein